MNAVSCTLALHDKMARRVVDQVDSLLNNVAGHLGMSLDDMDKRREMMRKVWEQVNNDPDVSGPLGLRTTQSAWLLSSRARFEGDARAR